MNHEINCLPSSMQGKSHPSNILECLLINMRSCGIRNLPGICLMLAGVHYFRYVHVVYKFYKLIWSIEKTLLVVTVEAWSAPNVWNKVTRVWSKSGLSRSECKSGICVRATLQSGSGTSIALPTLKGHIMVPHDLWSMEQEWSKSQWV